MEGINIEFINAIVYITRTDNPCSFYEYYTPNHSPLEIFNQEESKAYKHYLESPVEPNKLITSDELNDIVIQLIELNTSGTKIESKRIPLLSSEYKFKGYRQVKFSYEDSGSLHSIVITHKKKEIYFEHTIESIESIGD